MLLRKARVLIIAYATLGENLLLVNDLALTLGDWIKSHPKHVILQVIEVDQGLYDEAKPSIARTLPISKAIVSTITAPLPAVAPKVDSAIKKK